MERLRQRADFLAAATGTKAPSTAFVLQALKRRDDGPVRVGFTVSKKVGNAVERNRVRNPLRSDAGPDVGSSFGPKSYNHPQQTYNHSAPGDVKRARQT